MFGKIRSSESRHQPVADVLPQDKEQRAIPDAILGETVLFFFHNYRLQGQHSFEYSDQTGSFNKTLRDGSGNIK